MGTLGGAAERFPTIASVAMRPRVRAVVRPVLLAVNTPIARRRLRRIAKTAPRPIRLEVGGHAQRDGWIVTNLNAVATYFLDATKPWPFEDGALSHVYADNMIEHVPLQAGRAVLAEAYRCLRPGGGIRLVTPDIREHARLYLAGEESVQGSVGDHYRSAGRTVEHSIDLIRIPIADWGHHVGYVYDEETLAAEYERAGFRSVKRYPLNHSDDPAFDGLESASSRGEPQLALEAVR